ncbi:hypothetical protein C8R43DRAFT_894419, partial [Mycena crocata]
MVEAQGKGTLHAHGLVWLEGHPSPQTLRDRLAESESFKDKMVAWLEDTIKCEMMNHNYNTLSKNAVRPKRIPGEPHPGTIPSPTVFDSAANYEKDYAAFVDDLIREYNWHLHQTTCWKYLRRGESMTDANCRMGMDGVTRPFTSVDPVTFAISLRRLHPWVSNYNDVVLFLLKCNMDIKFVGSGEAAKAFLYYITDYITKPALTVHAGLAALTHAITVTNTKFPDISDDSVSSDEGTYVGAMTSTVNSMMAHQEISHPQVLSYLIGGGDHYTSDKFAVLYWG